MPFGVPGFGSVPLMFRIIPMIVIGVFVYVIGSMLYRWFVNQTSPVQERYAVVVSKRAHASGSMHHHGMNHNGMHHSGSHTSYYVTFQFEDGERLELPVGGRDFGVLVEDDTGLLNYQGTRFNDFQRQR